MDKSEPNKVPEPPKELEFEFTPGLYVTSRILRRRPYAGGHEVLIYIPLTEETEYVYEPDALPPEGGEAHGS